MEEDFGIESAATAWRVIRMATADTADKGEEEEPVLHKTEMIFVAQELQGSGGICYLTPDLCRRCRHLLHK
jgi:hypothetical protein